MKTHNPTITVRYSNERGVADHGWLKSKYSFSFANYDDPAHMGFRSLRVINQDVVAPGCGFPTHPHRDMEIFSYVLQGTLKHQDSLGNGRELKQGQIQLMSAGTGVTHSEFNPSAQEPLHFLQIWIQPQQAGLSPTYTEWHPPHDADHVPKVLIISPTGDSDSATIQQDALVYRVQLQPGAIAKHEMAPGRGLWLQVIDGAVSLNGVALGSGDGARSESSGLFEIQAGEQPIEALLFDLK